MPLDIMSTSFESCFQDELESSITALISAISLYLRSKNDLLTTKFSDRSVQIENTDVNEHNYKNKRLTKWLPKLRINWYVVECRWMRQIVYTVTVRLYPQVSL